MKRYAARWSRLLVLLSTGGTVVCLGSSIILLQIMPGIWKSLAAVPVLLLLSAALFTIRGYTIENDAVLVHRLFWPTRIALDGLNSSTYEPEVLRDSVRVRGNGGFFSFTGTYSNNILGLYRSFATEFERPVVLRYLNRVDVFTPENPEAFAREVASRIKG